MYNIVGMEDKPFFTKMNNLQEKINKFSSAITRENSEKQKILEHKI